MGNSLVCNACTQDQDGTPDLQQLPPPASPLAALPPPTLSRASSTVGVSALLPRSLSSTSGRVSANRPAELSTVLGEGGEAAEAALTESLEQAALLLEQLKALTPRRAHHPINQQLQRADMWFEQLATGGIPDLRSCAGGAMLQALGDAIIQLELFLDGIGSGGLQLHDMQARDDVMTIATSLLNSLDACENKDVQRSLSL